MDTTKDNVNNNFSVRSGKAIPGGARGSDTIGGVRVVE